MAVVAKRLLSSSHGIFPRKIFSDYPIRASSSSAFSSLAGTSSATSSKYCSGTPFLTLPDGYDFDKDAWKIKPINGPGKMKPINGDPRYYSLLALLKEDAVITRNRTSSWRGNYLTPEESNCIGSSKGWLALMNRDTCDFYLFNPFSFSSIPLPPIETLPTVLSKISKKKFPPSLSSMEKPSCCSVVTEFECFQQSFPIPAEELSKFFIKKVALSSSPLSFGQYEEIQNNQNCTAMIIHGHNRSRLAFCRIGDSSWTELGEPRLSYEDIIYFSKDQKFYALSDGHVDAWDLSRGDCCPMTALGPPIRSALRWTAAEAEEKSKLPFKRYLAESDGELLLVIRWFANVLSEKNTYKITKYFDVFKLDFEKNDLVHRTDLGGRSLFLGLNEAVSADFDGLKEDSIYFTCLDAEVEPDTCEAYDDLGKAEPKNCGAYDLGVYSLKNKEIQSLYRGIGQKNSKPSPIQPSPVWIFPREA